MKLIVDVVDPYGPEVRFAELALDGQWVEFYALLAYLRTDPTRRDEYLGVERLHAMALWSGGKQLASVGKEVARHCSRLRREGLDLIDSKVKTRYWRLQLPPERIEFRPSREIVTRWLEARTRTSDVDESWIEALETLLDAQLALRSGRGAQACDLLRERASFAHADLDAWAGLVDARGTDQHVDVSDNPGALDVLAEDWSRRSDALGRSVAARILARIGLRKRFIAAQEQYAILNKLATELEHRGDISALAAVLNVLGILATRLDRPRESIHHLLRAVAMFGVVGDFSSVEAALFNLANAHVRSRQLMGEAPNHESLRLLEMSRAVCRAFAVGGDTVQSEVSGAHWAMDMGDYDVAWTYVEAAAEVVTHLDSAFDQGCYSFARARLELLAPRGRCDPARDLRVARREFASVGAQATVGDVDTVLARVADDE